MLSRIILRFALVACLFLKCSAVQSRADASASIVNKDPNRSGAVKSNANATASTVNNGRNRSGDVQSNANASASASTNINGSEVQASAAASASASTGDKPNTPTTNNENECGENQELVECPLNCPSVDECPENENYNQPCSAPNQDPNNCPSECKCIFNHRRAQNGTCISTYECPPFNCKSLNTTYSACPLPCPGDNCPSPSSTIINIFCAAAFPIISCIPQCVCIEGYARNYTGDCVLKEDCPGLCTNNEEYTNCTQAICRDNSCAQVATNIVCLDNDDPFCTEGCVCIEKYLRAENGTCIPQEECNSQTGLCPNNEEYTNCTRAICRDNSCAQVATNIECLDYDDPFCTEGCVCIEKYLRAENGTCIPKEECNSQNLTPFGLPGIIPIRPRPCYGPYCKSNNNCPENEQYTQMNDSDDCSYDDSPECGGKCVCQESYSRNENGNCISSDQYYPNNYNELDDKNNY